MARDVNDMLVKIAEQVDLAIGQNAKFKAGSNNAATKVRKAMQEIKALAQEVRTTIQEARG